MKTFFTLIGVAAVALVGTLGVLGFPNTNKNIEETNKNIEECGQLASHPDQDDKIGAGAATDRIDAGAAIAACETARERAPESIQVKYWLGRALYAAKRYDEAGVQHRYAADRGYPPAQAALGWLYYRGEGVSKDAREAARWYRKAAEHGHALAQTTLGLMYHRGEGVPKDAAQALHWYRQAAEQGNAHARFNIGMLQAEQGVMAAQIYVAHLFRDGSTAEGVTRDPAQAARWYRRAAEQGSMDAQVNLGLLYEAGEGAGKNLHAAENWLRKAADQGSAAAKGELGRIYSGMEKRFVDASNILLAARREGYEPAFIYLGDLYGAAYLKHRTRDDPWTSFYSQARDHYQEAANSNNQALVRIAKERIAKLDDAHRRGPLSAGEALLGLFVLGVGLSALSGGDDATSTMPSAGTFDSQKYCMDVMSMTGTAAGCF